MDLSQYSSSPSTYKYFLKQNAQKMLDEVAQMQQQASQQQDQQQSMDQAAPVILPTVQPQLSLAQTPTSQPSAQLQGSILSKPGPLTQAFGAASPVEHYSGGVNYGADIGVPEGTQAALPPGNWRVLQAFNGAKSGGQGDPEQGINSGYGNSVLAQNLDTGEKLRFSHLSKVDVNPGATVQGGVPLGLTGHTGNTTGPHLDLEYYDKNGKINDVMKSIYAKYLDVTGQKTAGPAGGGNPIQGLQNAFQKLYKGYTESSAAYGQNPNAGLMETIGNSTANSPVGEVGQVAGMIGHAVGPALSNLGHAAPMLGMLGTSMGSAAQKFSPLAYKIHPDDQQALIDMINAGKLNPQQQTDLQNLSQHYLGGQYPYKTTPSLLKTFDTLLGAQNRQPDPQPWTGR